MDLSSPKLKFVFLRTLFDWCSTSATFSLGIYAFAVSFLFFLFFCLHVLTNLVYFFKFLNKFLLFIKKKKRRSLEMEEKNNYLHMYHIPILG